MSAIRELTIGIGLVLDELLEGGARRLGLAAEQLAERPVARGVARVLPAGVGRQVRVEAASAGHPLAVEHPQVRREERRLFGPWRLAKAPLHVLVPANGLFVAIGARERARRVERVFGALGARGCLRTPTGPWPPRSSARRARKSAMPASALATQVRELVGSRAPPADEIDGMQRFVEATRVREHARARHQLFARERVLGIEPGGERERVGRRRAGPPPASPATGRRRAPRRPGGSVRRTRSARASASSSRVLRSLATTRSAAARARRASCAFSKARAASSCGPGDTRIANHSPASSKGPTSELGLGAAARHVVGKQRQRALETHEQRQRPCGIASRERDPSADVADLGPCLVGVGHGLERLPCGVPFLVADEGGPRQVRRRERAWTRPAARGRSGTVDADGPAGAEVGADASAGGAGRHLGSTACERKASATGATAGPTRRSRPDMKAPAASPREGPSSRPSRPRRRRRCGAAGCTTRRRARRARSRPTSVPS